jgi:carbon storage regulator
VPNESKAAACNMEAILAGGSGQDFLQLKGECQMLVLMRRKGERILIGDDIWVEVIEVRNDKVRLGITAPKDVVVHREEVSEAIKEQNK